MKINLTQSLKTIALAVLTAVALLATPKVEAQYIVGTTIAGGTANVSAATTNTVAYTIHPGARPASASPRISN